MARQQVHVEIEGHRLALSNLDKVLYPATGFTKGQVLDYYRRIAPTLLPHLTGRPLSLKRFPDGVTGDPFFEKRCPRYRPDWVETLQVTSGSGTVIDFCLAIDLPSLIWLANLATLELHTYLFKAPHDDRPTVLVFDLDPGEPAGLADCCALGLDLRDLLTDLGLASWAKTSGGKGLHVYAPLNTPNVDFTATKRFARAVAQRFASDHPKRVTAVMAKAQRGGKVFIDWSQNDRAKTTVAAYSLRGRDRPTVSTPVSWDDIQRAVRRGTEQRLVFEAHAVPDRVADMGDLFAPVLTRRQTLPPIEALHSTT